jgi:hypothetical protein
MKLILFIISLLGSFLMVAPSVASGQNSTVDNSANGSSRTGGLSSESVGLAVSNETTQALNSSGSAKDAGGLYSESVTESKY